ncbi:hypothetical protein C2U72_13725 [Prosthecomicrobium hirschii]|uniref:GlgB N-terminal domain-containing protein n=1 Tax=Prosthecodimorpha hirschii TaxID=665126 RepID=UPI001AEE5715|nr:hypothetical protein [Prosthecomicrobium hirschii]TPQ50387.1 hypothetical protein C2U72_13725 [Prosthecomicrobium hirschii]
MEASIWEAGGDEVAALVGARHGDPFGLLGLHETAAGLVLRAFVPGAATLEAVPDDGAPAFALGLRDPAGFFEGLVPAAGRFGYRLRAGNAGGSWMVRDAYAFGPVLGAVDDHLLVEGTHRQLYERLGAHPITHEGVDGVHFAVWAPNAQRVSVALDLVDRFSDGDAQRAYVKLSDDLKPWWDMIQDQQRKIMAATVESEREALIASRDELLLAFIRDHNLAAPIDQLVDSFEPFDRCLTVHACDEDVIRRSIAIDVKRLYRTFKPYIQAKRDAPKPEERDKDFGKGLESLFFRFLS